MNTSTGSIRYLHILLQCLKNQGYRRSDFLKSLDIPLDFMNGQTLRLPAAQIEFIWEKARQLTNAEDLGLICADGIVLADFGIMAHYWMNCENLREGFNVSRKLEKLMHTGMYGEFVPARSGYAEYTTNIKSDNSWTTGAFVEFDFLSILRIGQLLVAEDNKKNVLFEKVTFCHSANAPEEYYQQLFNCPVEFNGRKNIMLVSDKTLDIPVYSPDPAVKKVIANAVTELVNKTVLMTISAQVEDILERSLRKKQVLKLTDAAKALNISSSTLKRKIQEEGLTFSDIDKKVKLNLSKQLILEGSLSTEQIAEQLNYTDATSFHRAFKSWTGITPKQFRQGKNLHKNEK